jgi:hypothetical protein
MSEDSSTNGSEKWRGFIRDHSKMFLLFIAAAILALVGAILVFLWFVGQAQSTGIAPATLGLWTMGNIVTFLINLIFWEFLLIGIPTIVAVVAVWQWWKRLPAEKKKEYRLFGRRSNRSRGGNAISPLVFIAFCIKVFLDGNWNVAVSTFSFDYFAYSIISAFIWIMIIFGIPMAIGLAWWLSRGAGWKMEKS